MRRQLITRFNFDGGYSDSRNPLAERANVSAEGSFGMLRLGESYNRPFQGYYSKGTLAASGKSTGAGLMFPLGDTWGGIKFNSGSASGSVSEDADQRLYYIGAGKPMREGVTIQKESGTFVYDQTADIDAGTDTITENTHGMVTGDVVYLTIATGTALAFQSSGLIVNRAYYVYKVDTNSFKLCATLADAIAANPVNIAATVNTITVHKGTDIELAANLQVASNPVTDGAGLAVMYQDEDDCGLSRPDIPLVDVPSTIPTGYTGLFNGTRSFQIARVRDRNNEGIDLDTVQTIARGIASATSAVTNPQNKTVSITFPTVASNQTHWAVFATKEGFGGVGVHYRAPYRTSTDDAATLYYAISETTVAAAANRTLTFDFRDSDLYPEEAWIYDEAPQDGTFFVDIDAVKVVLGCYDGTIGMVSMPNMKESYNPRHIITFPEPVTATLQRIYGEQALVACRNSIHILSYEGFRGDDTPSCVLRTLVPDVGIKKPSNWAYGAGMIVAWIDGAGLATISVSGGLAMSADIDYTFGREVAKFTRNWTSDDVKIGFDPNTRSFVAAYQNVSVSYCIESGAWADPVYLTDCGFGSAVTVQSMTAAKGELVVSLNDSSNYTAYSYDNNGSTTRMPICQIGQWEIQQSGGRGNGIYEIAVATRQGGTVNSTTPEAIIVGLHSNLFPTYLRGNSVSHTSNTNRITNAAGVFTSAWTGRRAVIFGTDIGGSGVHYLSVVLTYGASTYVTMTSPTTGNTVNAQATASGCFMLIGERFWTATPVTGRDQHYYNLYPNLQDARSFTVSAYLPCLKGSETVIDGGVFAIDVFGTNWQTGTVRK